MANAKIKNKNVYFQCVRAVGDEGRHLSVNTVLVALVLLWFTVFCFQYCERRLLSINTVLVVFVLLDYKVPYLRHCVTICYCGCYCCNHIRMPPLGNIVDCAVMFFHIKKLDNFRSILLEDTDTCQRFFWYHQRAFLVHQDGAAERRRGTDGGRGWAGVAAAATAGGAESGGK